MCLGIINFPGNGLRSSRIAGDVGVATPDVHAVGNRYQTIQSENSTSVPYTHLRYPARPLALDTEIVSMSEKFQLPSIPFHPGLSWIYAGYRDNVGAQVWITEPG
ncbi:hypothetical protein GWI33_021109 [Rhynchophorus ferrugineus]|uniref:Uncharacterized protein n=1 Tax=Rhynchophorus ferrugineus TaxID=354439 RepID=A0A834LZW2_RHYFE|nr:hypothetical protein GWI33_021109 [Rhynchophorus ferrugineus]